MPFIIITIIRIFARKHKANNIRILSLSVIYLRFIVPLFQCVGGTSRAQWEDVTGSTPLTFVNDCVSFTTTVSARFWLMDCRNVAEAAKMATDLYREAINVPFMAKYASFSFPSFHVSANVAILLRF